MKTQVLIIGAGATGAGIIRDLALRGLQCLLLDKKDVNAGASGGNHGLLHSGARYVASDAEAANECAEEGRIIKSIAPQCIEETSGFFVAVAGDDENYIADFPGACHKCGIKATPIDSQTAREMEPNISEKTIAAYEVPDAAVDPFMLTLDNVAHARQLGSSYMRFSEVVGFDIRNEKIETVHVRNTQTNEIFDIQADWIVNASGAWAGNIAKMANIPLEVLFSKGTLLVTQKRLSQRVINRLRQASDADILVPGGSVSIIGTTSVRIPDPDDIWPTVQEVDAIVEEGAMMMPILEQTRYIRAYCGVRPLISQPGASDDRNVSRGFSLINHAQHGVKNMTSITGGKLTTYRLMAEKTSDMVCDGMGISVPCKTHTTPLPSTTDGRWTEPGLSPQEWMQHSQHQDVILCECEMIPKSAVDYIISNMRSKHGNTDLTGIGIRSRVGKGPCQGTYCSARIASHMVDRGDFSGTAAIEQIQCFLQERWRGQRPLLWDMPMIQSELQEAIHCGFLNLDGYLSK
ncbi:MAG: Anaerobic glycerol-3-phosphate dehydrogenase subunit A [Candidatus Magnetoglobus multicellularis str. Araruama]|uniref:Anaerobic glycerol-3-phosphate dehydrogenase subunit A n=1 Tax=Candidatus Magnetoglobus multicellularis str. Araruama TaxID=890399 RepID=A0A1V1PEV8_9BACT|nr:MAG: Anaerobic glycerol-3-phosphate dehydrogenase subunit A [Candidatus Magnetoglobus multicellularis str. Araruama]